MLSSNCIATMNVCMNTRCAIQMPVLPYCALFPVANDKNVKKLKDFKLFPYFETNIEILELLKLQDLHVLLEAMTFIPLFVLPEILLSIYSL